jgi:hypothetical protein
MMIRKMLKRREEKRREEKRRYRISPRSRLLLHCG